ncbi:cation-transporting P-type ATPase [Arthrobacter sp. TB 26]|uniref:cation-transporting P-type ATPase n=1 Tax=Arthrobacter sp. TB 26 TaxID=494420 RepID=UPI000462C77C|nr:cation-transporting P-type ATPase [Arthrobacter sp. TB 26]
MAAELRVDPARGLSAAEAQQRLQEYGPNALAAAKPEPVWKQFFKHYADDSRSCLWSPPWSAC